MDANSDGVVTLAGINAFVYRVNHECCDPNWPDPCQNMDGGE